MPPMMLYLCSNDVRVLLYLYDIFSYIFSNSKRHQFGQLRSLQVYIPYYAILEILSVIQAAVASLSRYGQLGGSSGKSCLAMTQNW
jgi:hypothetical protein